jgi:hypothetical protein
MHTYIPVLLILTSAQRRGTKQAKLLYKEEGLFLKEEFSLANRKEKM